MTLEHVQAWLLRAAAENSAAARHTVANILTSEPEVLRPIATYLAVGMMAVRVSALLDPTALKVLKLCGVPINWVGMPETTEGGEGK